MKILDKAYDPKEIEKDVYQSWEQSGAFIPNMQGPAYSIAIPPPNVTGSLHMGHAFQQTLMDVLTRYHRMQQNNTLWLVGTDHAGIATQMMVERKLHQQNISRHDLGRDKFVDEIWRWKQESGNQITKQMRRLGASVDWTRERFTLDQGLNKAVIEVFVQLYDENIIYRGKKLVNWDPVLKTALSDLEVEAEEENSFLWYIRYPFAAGEGYLTVATTRPETLFGDVAVAVNPEDSRYQAYIGKFLRLPLTDRVIPIIGDSDVLPDFGTGCVKITPAHDFNDYAMGQKHHLPQINILNLDATTNENVPQSYQGLDRFIVRKKVIEDLNTAQLLAKEEPYLVKIPRGDRSNAILEPLLTDQWFVKVESLAKPAIEAVKTQKIRFIPENWSKTYFDWMYNIQDWCISRQLWWGHRIPAWYDEKGSVYVAKNESEAREKYHLASDVILKQDDDVLDTWFSSALWPFSTLGWPEKTTDLKTFYPTQVLVTGFDIIFFWVARMIMFGLKFANNIPFQEVYIHGLIQDQDGVKMSKTKGNVLDPLDLIDGISIQALLNKRLEGLTQPKQIEKIEKNTKNQFPDGIPAYGTDALRFTFCALATANRHIRFDLARIEGYKHFCNKLWNATRFVFMNLKDFSITSEIHEAIQNKKLNLNIADRWIISRWQKTLQEVEQQLKVYRFDLASYALYEFTWNEFCDWYLEFSKPILNTDQKIESHSQSGLLQNTTITATRYTLITILESLLRALHPFMPFITEKLWQEIAPIANVKIIPCNYVKQTTPTVMLQPYPKFCDNLVDNTAEADIEWIKAFILAIRNIRGEMNISPAKSIPLLLQGPHFYKEKLDKHQTLIQNLAKIDSFSWIEKDETRPHYAGLVRHSTPPLKILVLMEGMVDLDAEIKRLEKELKKAEQDLTINEKKLSNEAFLAKAPPEVLESSKKLMHELEVSIPKIKQSIAQLQILKS